MKIYSNENGYIEKDSMENLLVYKRSARNLDGIYDISTYHTLTIYENGYIRNEYFGKEFYYNFKDYKHRLAYAINELNGKELRTIKVTAGMTGEFELILTDANNDLFKEQLEINSDMQNEGMEIVDPYILLKTYGYNVIILGCQDDFGEDDLKEIIIDAEFDYYNI